MKNTVYGNYKNFNENNFLYELDQDLAKGLSIRKKSSV